MARHRHIGPWTINNPTEDDFTKVRTAVENGDCKYLVFCHETGESGTYHLQGYAQATKAYTMKRWHKVLGERFATHKRVSPDDVEAAIQYCKGQQMNPDTGEYEKKEGSGEFEEFGTPNEQGKRTDILNMKAAIDEDPNLTRIQTSDQHFTTWFNNPHATREYVNVVKKKKALETIFRQYENTEWKPWQQGILDMIDEKADSRTVNWLYDEGGNIGKSYLTTYLAAQGKAYCPDVTKISDILYGYNYEPIVIFDIPRSKQEHMEHLYTAMEQFKNGRFFAGKYESKTMVFEPPHVIVFANFTPQTRKENGELTLSMDRWCIIPLHVPINDADSFKRLRTHAVENQEQTDTLITANKKRKTGENTTHCL
jgi:hypothetical protein